MAAAIPSALSGIGAIFQGIGRSKPQTSTSTSQSTSTQEAKLTGKQRKVNKSIFEQIIDVIRQGPTVSQSDRNTARSQINQNYDSANDNLEASLVARGYGDSGKVGQGFRDNSIQRNNAFQSAEAGLRNSAWDRFMQAVQAGFQFDQPRSFTNTSSGTQTGTVPGASPWSTIGSGVSDLSSMLFMNGMMGKSSNPLGSSPFPWIGRQPICAIAAELYGASNWQTFVARAWLLERAASSRKWAVIVKAYQNTGPALALVIRKSNVARKVFQYLFSKILCASISEAAHS
jgi:hypothetical protein